MKALLLAALGCSLAGTLNASPPLPDSPPSRPAAVVVIGAGPAGLAAALEAAEYGAVVTLVEMNSVAGGHGVKAGGFAMAGTALQSEKGIDDNPQRAYRDWLAYGESNDRDWTRRYAEASDPEVYQWLTDLGVAFKMLLPSAENSVPRFHFTRGTAVHVMVPMIASALQRPTIYWRLQHRADELLHRDGGVYGVVITDLRTQNRHTLFADQVIIATGGFQGALGLVRQHWSLSPAAPDTLLAGGSRFATGSGLALGEAVDAGTHRLDQQVIFVNALRNPRAPDTGLALRNSAAVWVNSNGDRFVNETADDKTLLAAVLAQPQQRYWAVTDSRGLRRLMVRDAPWLNRETIAAEIIDNPALIQQADAIPALATAMDVSTKQLEQSLLTFNRAVREGASVDRWQRPLARLKPIDTPPYYAIPLQLMSRKNLGGLAVNADGQVVNRQGQIIPGLYAAGEVTGVAGINGAHGMSGTFLGPSVWQGRLAGRHAAANSRRNGNAEANGSAVEPSRQPAPILSMSELLTTDQPGYWHAREVHRLVREQTLECSQCHSEQFPPAPAVASAERSSRLATCSECH